MTRDVASQEGQVTKRIVSCRLPMDLIEELNCIADQEGFSRSQLMRQMLRAYVEYLRNDDQLHGQEEEK